ncbi:MAG: glycosyltransferase family 39 protein [Clostridia bacterium]|nr:glycosyltransferase family 39 protein [Clostridia bacterium]
MKQQTYRVSDLFEKYQSHRLVKLDRILLLCLTLVYGIIALLNLGTLSFPTTVYRGEVGESFTLDFGQEVNLTSLWVNGNIAQGTLRFVTEGEDSRTFTQDQGDMFKWHQVDLGLSARYLQVTVENREVAINELAFFENGTLLPVTALEGTAAYLVDEQDTVPAAPSYFNGMIFDEIYHARTAYENIHNMSIYEWTHPPRGKLIIALGILIFGMKPFGWRIMGTLFGVAMVPLMYVFAKRIFKRTDYAFLTAGLWAFDCMHFTQTRIATIDVYGVFFILLMFFFMYEYVRQDFFSTPMKEKLRPLAFCGVAFGLGCSSKWIGCYAGAGLAVVLFYHLICAGFTAYKGHDKGAMARRSLYRQQLSITLLWCVLWFVLVPGLIYFVSYFPYYRYQASIQEDYGLLDMWDTLIKNQKDMYNYHSQLTATHMCQSTWYQWPFTFKSVWFYVSGGNGTISNISSTGNPAIWWISSVGAVCLFLEWVLGKVKRDAVLPILFVGVLANYLPWVLVSRCVFLYHFFATVPFILLSTVYLLFLMERENRRLGWLKWAWLSLAVVYFVLLYPAISGLPTGMGYAGFLENVLPASYLYYGWV